MAFLKEMQHSIDSEPSLLLMCHLMSAAVTWLLVAFFFLRKLGCISGHHSQCVLTQSESREVDYLSLCQ